MYYYLPYGSCFLFVWFTTFFKRPRAEKLLKNGDYRIALFSLRIFFFGGGGVTIHNHPRWFE